MKTIILSIQLIALIAVFSCGRKAAEQQAGEKTEVATPTQERTVSAMVDRLDGIANLTDDQKVKIQGLADELGVDKLTGDAQRDGFRKMNNVIRSEILTPEQVEAIRAARAARQGGGGE